VKLFFAGADNIHQHEAVLARAGVRNRLQSYYSLGGRPPSTNYDMLLLDSGGFSARTKGVVIDVLEFAEYVNRHSIRYAFNLDTNDVEETLENQAQLVARCPGTTIIPVYHLSDFQSDEHRGLLERFEREGFSYVGIGGVAGEGSPVQLQQQFYRYVFRTVRDRVRLHGLGITARRQLREYPWYSVDSTSWLSSARFGSSSTLRDPRVKLFEARTKNYKELEYGEAVRWLQVEAEVTRLWTERGITWQ
jgi:hypothetical protein